MSCARGTLHVFGACLLALGAPALAADAPAPAPAYAGIHSLALTVRNLPKARVKIEKALAASGGKSTVGPDNQVGSDKVGYAQWSWAVPAKALKKLLKDLRRLGKVTRDAYQPTLPTLERPVPPADTVLLNLAVDGPPVHETK